MNAPPHNEAFYFEKLSLILTMRACYVWDSNSLSYPAITMDASKDYVKIGHEAFFAISAAGSS